MVDQIGEYKIINKIGSGAMGVVYKGFDPKMGRYVAIKTMTAEFADNEEILSRFHKEAVATAKLFHRNIVAVYDLDAHDGVPFIVMEFLDGRDLKFFRRARHQFTAPQILNVLAQTADGLDYAHKLGVVHRDVKPANVILLKNGVIKVLDFGIARVMDSPQQTRTGVALGTPAYMSPEQVQCSGVDHRTDQYSLGVIGYEFFSGKNPFDTGDYASSLCRVMQHVPAPLQELEKNCPGPVSSAIARALSKNRDDRFPDMKAFAAALREVLERYDPAERAVDRSCLSVDLGETPESLWQGRIQEFKRRLQDGEFDLASRLLKKLASDGLSDEQHESLKGEIQHNVLRRRAEDLVRVGLELSEKGDLDLALANFQEACRIHPDSVDAVTNVQKIFALKKERLFREQIAPLMSESAGESAAGHYIEAIELARRALLLDPDYVEAASVIEENERLLRKAAQARRLASEVLPLLGAGDFPKSFELLKQLEELSPDSDETKETRDLVWRSLISDFTGRFQGASDPSGLKDLRSWARQLFGARPVVAFFSDPGHNSRRREFFRAVEECSSGLLSAGKPDAVKVVLGVLDPMFSGSDAFRALSARAQVVQDEVHGDRMRRLAEEKGLATEFEAETRSAREKALAALRLREKLDRARDFQQKGRIAEAMALVEEAGFDSPGNSDVRLLRDVLEEQARHRQELGEIDRVAAQIRRAMAEGRPEKCVETAREAVRRFPGEKNLQELFAALQQMSERARARGEVALKRKEIEELVGEGGFLRAGKIAFDLRDRFPEDPASAEACAFFQSKRGEFIAESIWSTKGSRESGDLASARSVLENAISECPDSVDLQAALREIHSLEFIRRGVSEAGARLGERRYDLALSILEGLLSRCPEETNVAGLYSEAKKQREAYIGEVSSKVYVSVGKGDFDAAVALLGEAENVVPNSTELRDIKESIGRMRQELSSIETAVMGAKPPSAGGRFDGTATSRGKPGPVLDTTRLASAMDETAMSGPQTVVDLGNAVKELRALAEKRGLAAAQAHGAGRGLPPPTRPGLNEGGPAFVGPATGFEKVPFHSPVAGFPGASEPRRETRVHWWRSGKKVAALLGTAVALAAAGLAIAFLRPGGGGGSTRATEEPPPAASMEAWFELEGQAGAYNDDHLFKKEKFKVCVRSGQDGFLCILWCTPGETRFMFPHVWANAGDPRVRQNQTVRIFSTESKKWIQFSDKPEVVELFVVWARQQEALSPLTKIYDRLIEEHPDPKDGAYGTVDSSEDAFSLRAKLMAMPSTIRQGKSGSPAPGEGQMRFLAGEGGGRGGVSVTRVLLRHQ